jgi:outer membrane lipoprotein SlyB
MATSDCYQNHVLETAMKRLIICTAVLGLAFSSAAQAKGCIKGAIVGGAAGSVAGHGKVGAVAGCVIGHHEANKADAENAKAQAPISPSRGDGKN